MRAPLIWLHKTLHEVGFVNVRSEEESRKFHEIFFTQAASSVKIVAPDLVTGREVILICIDIASEAARY